MPAIPLPFSDRPVSEWIAQLIQAEVAEERFRALQAIGLLAIRDEVSKWAARSLRDSDSAMKALAAKLLGNGNATCDKDFHEIENQISSLLTDADPDVRFESARALIRLKSEQGGKALPVLFAFFGEQETQPLMLAAVMNALSEVDSFDEPQLQTLQRNLDPFLKHDRAEVREAVATVFSKWPMMCRSNLDQVRELLDDNEPVVREKIAFALGRAGVNTDEVRTALQAACQDEDQEVARTAKEALDKLS